MGTLGTNIQTTVSNILEDPNFRTSITITPITQTEDSYGGYTDRTKIEGAEVSTYAIPARYMKTQLGFKPFGDLKKGESRIIIKGTETIEAHYRITMDSTDFDVIEVKPLYFNDVVVAYAVRLSKRQ